MDDFDEVRDKASAPGNSRECGLGAVHYGRDLRRSAPGTLPAPARPAEFLPVRRSVRIGRNLTPPTVT